MRRDVEASSEPYKHSMHFSHVPCQLHLTTSRSYRDSVTYNSSSPATYQNVEIARTPDLQIDQKDTRKLWEQYVLFANTELRISEAPLAEALV